MPWRVEYHPGQEYVASVYWGETSADEIREATVASIALAKEHEATRGLVDCLEQTKTGSTLDIRDLPQLYASEGLSRSVQIAFVEPAKPELKDLAVFYETVCTNRGWKLRRFQTREEATDWLLSDEQ